MTAEVAALAVRFEVAALAVKFENQNTDPDASNLRSYWVHGAGAALIDWSSPGSIDRCEALVGAKAPKVNAASLCRSYYKDATGGAPFSDDVEKPREEPEASLEASVEAVDSAD